MTTIPRVSDILAILYPNSLDYVGQEHLDRGTRLHQAMEYWVNDGIYCGHHGGFYDKGIQPVTEWLKGQEVVFESAELEVSHKYGVLGHPDLLCTWKGVPCWFDWKFSEQLTEQNRLQGTVYNKMTGRKGYFIQCPSNGKVKAIKCQSDPMLWSYFLSALNVWKFHHRKD